MTAEGYKTFINGSVMASFMEGIVASILEEKSGAGYGTNCSQLNTVISVIEAMYLCEGMWLFPFCAEDRFFNQPSCIYARAKPRRAKYTHRTKLRFVLCVFRPCRGLSRRIRRWVRKRTPICPLTLALEVKERVAGADCCIGQKSREDEIRAFKCASGCRLCKCFGVLYRAIHGS